VASAAEETAKQVKAFGQDAAAQIGPALEEAWKHVDAFGQDAGKQISAAAQQTTRWIQDHPGETAGIVACVAAAPAGVAAAGGVLHMVGFTATGVAAGMYCKYTTTLKPLCLGNKPELTCLPKGSAAAAAQASIGDVAAGSTFAILQSAAAGGAGAALVNGIAAGTATAAALVATVPALVKAAREGKQEVTVDDVTYKLEDMGMEEHEAAEKEEEGEEETPTGEKD